MNACSPEGKLLQNESNEIESSGNTVELLTALNHSLYKACLDEAFPIRVIVTIPDDDTSKAVEEIAKESESEFVINNNLAEIICTNKALSDKLVKSLCDSKLDIQFDYSKLISHPGLLFVKRLSTSKVNSEELKSFFNLQSLYQSLIETNLISSKNNESYAILKFDNYLDCEHILSNFKYDDNPFHEDPKVSLYINKYISKKERALKDSQFYTNTSELLNDGNLYNSIVLENLTMLFKGFDLTLNNFGTFISKFQAFHPIEFMLFPVKKLEGEDKITLEDYGYISFKQSSEMNMNVLKCLYYLNNLERDELMNFDYDKMIPIEEEEDVEEKEDATNDVDLTLKISINQHRFNHYLHLYKPNQMVLCLSGDSVMLKYLDYNSYNQITRLLLKTINYQETNIYVNNLSILFKNDDKLWEQFWSQFGEIKSAKIIKPEYYSKKLNNYGRIGFIFYKKFKMALKAIILTNMKIVDYNDQTIAIKSSFAIQKSLTQNSQQRGIHNPANYFVPPLHNGAGTNYPISYTIGYFPMYNPYIYMLNPTHNVNPNPNMNSFQPHTDNGNNI